MTVKYKSQKKGTKYLLNKNLSIHCDSFLKERTRKSGETYKPPLKGIIAQALL